MLSSTKAGTLDIAFNEIVQPNQCLACEHSFLFFWENFPIFVSHLWSFTPFIISRFWSFLCFFASLHSSASSVTSIQQYGKNMIKKQCACGIQHLLLFEL